MQQLRIYVAGIYVAGPYSGATPEKVQENVKQAVDAGIASLPEGPPPLRAPPHPPGGPARAMRPTTPFRGRTSCAWDAPWLEASDALLLLGHSRGADIELEQARTAWTDHLLLPGGDPPGGEAPHQDPDRPGSDDAAGDPLRGGRARAPHHRQRTPGEPQGHSRKGKTRP